MIKRLRIPAYQKGLLFEHGEFKKILSAGGHWIPVLNNNKKIIIVSQRATYLAHEKLVREEIEQVGRSGLIDESAMVLDLGDNERALVWRDNRFYLVLGPGMHILWKEPHRLKIEVIDASGSIFKHKDLEVIAERKCAQQFLDFYTIEEGHVGVFFSNGTYVETLSPGRIACWKKSARYEIFKKDIREKMMDVPGQEIMTSDKVTLRINSLVSYHIEDPLKAVVTTEAVDQFLYRESQLALRAVIGAHELDEILHKKENISKELEQLLRDRLIPFGLRVGRFGIRDIILPGEMKSLLNKVTEARKAAEANLVMRREETAAMRSQLNTARMLENNPTLMRLKELEVLEKVIAGTNLKLVLSDKKMTDQLVHLL